MAGWSRAEPKWGESERAEGLKSVASRLVSCEPAEPAMPRAVYLICFKLGQPHKADFSAPMGPIYV